MPVLLDQTTGESITLDVESTPIDDPAVLPSTPSESGLPTIRQRYAQPSRVDLSIILALVPADGSDPAETVEAWIRDRAARAVRLTYEAPVDGDSRADLLIGAISKAYQQDTSTRILQVTLQESRPVTTSTADVTFPDAADQDAVSGPEDGGRQAGEDGPQPGIAAALIGGIFG